jgi:hypothetical protein
LIGWRAGENITSGPQNTIVGYAAGSQATNKIGSKNIYYGWYAGYPGATMAGDGGVSPSNGSTNNIIIGNNVGIVARGLTIAFRSNQVVIGNNDNDYYYQWLAGWYAPSDARDKIETGSIGLGLDFINQLDIKKFKWNKRSKYQDEGSNDGSLASSKYSWGVIAQNLIALTGSYPVLSDIIDTTEVSYKDGTPYEMYVFNHDLLLWPAVQAIKEVDSKISNFNSNISSSQYFYDQREYEVQDYRHQFYYFSGEASSSSANSWSAATSNDQSTGALKVTLPLNSAHHIKIKWIGRSDETGNIVSTLREDTILVQKDGGVLTYINKVNTVRTNEGIGFDTNYIGLDTGDGSGDGLALQFRIGNYEENIVDLSARSFNFRVKAVVEILSVDHL